MSMIFLFISTAVILTYCLFIAVIAIYFKQTAFRNGNCQGKISIIIPCRNEAETIGICLHSIVKQSMPGVQFEVIVVDDFSEDYTIKIAEQFKRALPLTILKNKLPGKKNALTEGILHARHDIILTTDADCTMGPEWLNAMLSEFEDSHLNMLCGPVNFNDSDQLFQQLQQTESAAIIGISAVMLNAHRPSTCNGANLMFRKSVFDKIGGYTSHRELASGDDDLLMHEFYRHDAARVKFNLNQAAMVHTMACSELIHFLHQRIRWIAKRKYYIFKWNAFLQVLILSQLIVFYFLLFDAIIMFDKLAIILIVVKLLADFIYGLKLKKVFNFKLGHILLMPFFESYIFLVLLFSGIKNKKWKGRNI